MKQITALLLLVLALLGCSEQPEPSGTLEAYMQAWQDENFEEMYELLSEQSKDRINEQEFVERYSTIYDGINMNNLLITYDEPAEDEDFAEEDQPSFSYEAEMETLAGALNFANEVQLTFEENEEEGKWRVNWDSSMIFPGMEEEDTVSAQSTSPERGEIFDVEGDPLAENGEVQQVGFVPGELGENEEEAKEEAADILDISVEDIDGQLNQSWVQASSFVPVGSIAAADEERIENITGIEGIQLQEKSARVYPEGESAAHLIGYISDVTAEQLEEVGDQGYSAGDQIGQAGLEYVLEDDLRGQAGGKVSILDENDEEKEVLAENEAVDGEDFNLTIDKELQQAVYESMEEKPGASSAIDPTTGEVKALVSSPSYDPNDIILGRSSVETTVNRFNKTYSPGSTFKPITAAIGLETGNIDPDEEMSIPDKTYTEDGWGGYSVSRIDGANVDDKVDLRDALVRSDNIYFARSILEIGADSFMDKSNDFGFSEEVPFSFPIEDSQIANEEEITEDVLLADTGYGQGQVQMSTLHLALSYTPFITNGDLLEPALIQSDDTEQVWREDVVSEETAARIREDLKAVVSDPEGSAYEPQLENVSLAGKTGTAELKESIDDEDGQENGWFIAWDTDQEDLLVSMMIENVENGSSEAVSKVKQVFEEMN
ncbi:penicillin-binding transpeptidase domain-containing protein [Halobacillus sp. A1]|uniref:penicillin-binding transpeptidase domain-containing protein n=1 Tax=Halobacillus sp. A1 TaxID=2880262 RepID=UPI0020A621D4|nr:penicillin-binding transpeptidase domain-containing protein [Halobacillus sp. A1]MCP3030602.1 penicillin-binding transpeptidase domain-containing protein [Halobacillus sp. A1]